MCENGGLGAIINASLDCNDALLMKIVRNISRHEGDMKHGFMDHIDALASSVVANPPDEVLVEMLGVFGNLTIPNVSGSTPCVLEVVVSLLWEANPASPHPRIF